MKLVQFSLRDVAEWQETFEGSPRSCHTSFMWLNWCPVDIVLWVLVVVIVLLVIWRTFLHQSGHRETAATGHASHKSRGHRKLYCRPDSMTLDPYHIPQTFNEFPIFKDTSLRGAHKFITVLNQEKNGPNSPGVTVKAPAQNWVERESGAPSLRPLSEDPFWVNYTAQFDVIAQPQSPPPAYVRSPRADI
ncbi:hypothetical protein D9619_013188 [Psilocybe cf. subviscida]|uniref:Uncharacterized protein n=1 Tax=Psilocybe cf. subviscida TaxID=2480587 RepID=A0A8H5EYS9_9AGAR|nr:hypothetical protein D9619_013188 [Psilocybe cf. subviscida]